MGFEKKGLARIALAEAVTNAAQSFHIRKSTSG